jgi:hypothetical protein
MDMPIWLRVFYIKEINKINEAKQKQQQKQQRQAANLSRPNITPRKT